MSYYVRCYVEAAQFSSEYFIRLINDATAAYVDRSNVRIQANSPLQENQHVLGEVQVYLVTEEAGRALIELPGVPVLGGLRTWVPRSDLLAA